MADKEIYLGSGPIDPHLQRSTFDLSNVNHLSATFGKIYPVFVQEMNPNDSITIKPRIEFDLMPVVFPLQARITAHLSFFKCAFRNLWKGYRDQVSRVGNHVMPYIKRSYNWHDTGSLADYMNIPSYISRSAYGYESVSTMADANFDYSRCFLLPVDGDKIQIYNIGDSEIAYYRADFMSEVFTNDALPSGNFCCRVTELCHHPIATDQPYLEFTIVNLSSSPVKMPNFSPKIIASYAGMHRGAEQLHYDTHFPITVFNFGNYSNESTDLVDRVDVGVGKFEPISSRAIKTIGDGFVYAHTYCAHLTTEFVELFNRLLTIGSSVRLVLSVENSNDNLVKFGMQFVPNSSSIDVVSLTGGISTQASTISNGHISFTASTYYLRYGGLQKDIRYRSHAADVYKSDNSPFIAHNGGEPVIPINALPFRMYQFVYNLYFRNQQVDPFIKNGQPTYNDYLSTDADGADLLTPLEFNYASYESDFLTTAKFTPQMGNAPLVGISHTPGADSAVFHFVDENDQPYNLRIATDSAGTLTGISEYGTNSNESTIKNLNALINYGISINDFRSVSAFQRFLERNQRAGFDYKSIIKEFYGTNAPIGEEFPEYIGGLSQPISIYKLENRAAGEYPLGFFAGAGRVESDSDNPVRCFCSERSYVMGLLWFTVTPVYSQVLPKHWTKSQLLDYFNPQFATIGNQPIYNYEVAPLQADNNTQLMSVFGYQRPWYEYTMRMDEAHGQFRDSQHNFLLHREFDSIPQLGHDFITINPDDLSNPFTYTQGSDKLFGACVFDTQLETSVPRFITPAIVG